MTIDIGTNRLVPEPADLPGAVQLALSELVSGRVTAGWDGHAGERIAAVLMGGI